jgi:hypothetical protein
MRRPLHRELVLLVLLIATAGCGDDDALTTPTQPTGSIPITESLTGTINTNGAETHPFGISDRGEVIATLKSVTPEDAVIGMSLGTWNDTVCQIALANDKAKQGNVIRGLASSLGNFCLRMYDSGDLTQETTYEVEVVHP